MNKKTLYKKIMAVFTIGQFILAVTVIAICTSLKKASDDASKIEKMFAKNCIYLQKTLHNVNTLYCESDKIIKNISKQFPKIRNGLQNAGYKINGLLPGTPGTPIVEVGTEFHNTSALLRNYLSTTAPTVHNSITQTANTIGNIGYTIKENLYSSKIYQYALVLGICFSVICILNGCAILLFAFSDKFNCN